MSIWVGTLPTADLKTLYEDRLQAIFSCIAVTGICYIFPCIKSVSICNAFTFSKIYITEYVRYIQFVFSFHVCAHSSLQLFYLLFLCVNEQFEIRLFAFASEYAARAPGREYLIFERTWETFINCEYKFHKYKTKTEEKNRSRRKGESILLRKRDR